jgi:hypothetical protein
VPPDGKQRFTVVLEGASNADLMPAWSQLCQVGSESPPEFRSVYPNVTTVQGNRFRFRGGDPAAMSADLQRLFAARLPGRSVQAHVEA